MAGRTFAAEEKSTTKTMESTGIAAPVGARRALRADARRNVEALIAAARDAFAEHGADASLDDIARSAGVGSGTLYRHFPNRLALMEAVYRDGVEKLAVDGERLLATEPPALALEDWLRGFVAYVSIKRGLARALTSGLGDATDLFAQCHAMIVKAGGALLDEAIAAGAIRPDADLMDLLRLAGAIASAAETSPEGPALSDRLLRLALDGVRPTGSAPR